ncbi:MAG TPA: hypothetical protein VNN09_06115 [Candidatus Competibacteraceae bacterium]|nr:hypothetical protein [Candidatus Competibacteraceae bacterium]
MVPSIFDQELTQIVGILDPHQENPLRQGVGWRLRRLVAGLLQDFNDRNGRRLRLELPGPLSGTLGWRRRVDILTEDPEALRLLLDAQRAAPRRVFTLIECYAPSVRILDEQGGHEVNLELERGRYRSPELLRNATPVSRQFRLALGEVAQQRPVRITSTALRDYVERLRSREPARLAGILQRTQTSLYQRGGRLELHPLLAAEEIDPLLLQVRQLLLARIQAGVAERGWFRLDARSDALHYRLARRYLGEAELAPLGLQVEDDPLRGALRFRSRQGGAPAATLSDQQLVEAFRERILKRIRAAIERDGHYRLEAREDPLNFRLARRYLDAAELAAHGLECCDQDQSLEFRSRRQGLEALLQELPAPERERLRKLLMQTQLAGESVHIAPEAGALLAFLERPEVREALERERGLTFVGSSTFGGRQGEGYLTRLLTL